VNANNSELFDMDIQTLNWLITGFFSLLFAFGWAKISGLRNDVKSAREQRSVEIDKLRSDIKLKEQAQENSARQYQALLELIREQVAVGNRMAENFRVDGEKRYAQEQQRHELIQRFIGEQNKTTDAVEILGAQIGKVHDVAKETSHDAKASRALTVEVDKSVESLAEEIRRQRNTIDGLKTEVVTALEAVIKQPLADEIRDLVQEAEKKILQHIDLLKKEEVKPLIITEVKPNEQSSEVVI
jgi:hypothetical protein